MSDNKKYYYLKLKEGFYDDVKIQVLESLSDAIMLDTFVNFLFY